MGIFGSRKQEDCSHCEGEGSLIRATWQCPNGCASSGVFPWIESNRRIIVHDSQCPYCHEHFFARQYTYSFTSESYSCTHCEGSGVVEV